MSMEKYVLGGRRVIRKTENFPHGVISEVRMRESYHISDIRMIHNL